MDQLQRVRPPGLEFIFQVRLYFTSRLRFPVDDAGSELGFVLIDHGVIEGPRLNGKVVPQSGGDWAKIRSNGVVVHQAHYILQADDGQYIYMRNSGYHAYPGKEWIGRLHEATEEQRAADYFRLTPTFETTGPAHEWLTKTVIVGAGERRFNPDHSVFDYYAVT
ncbi:MAG: DUF3237 domain-containing protein [Caulobacteraceae bacterium]